MTLYTINEFIGRKIFEAYDVGDTIFLHMFAAFFGLAASRALHTYNIGDNAMMTTTKTSDSFSLLGRSFR